MTYWTHLEKLVADSIITIDRPKGSRHPRNTEVIYPLDYGFLENTSANDGEGIAIALETHQTGSQSAILIHRE